MTIWLIALLLLGGTAAAGYTQGAIRASVSFFGIILSALLAIPLSKLIKPIVALTGVSSPIWLWALPPFIMFVILLIGFKVIGFNVHRKVDVYYKYKAGDLHQALWSQLNSRLGACVGLMNGLVYLVLISWIAFVFSYWTVQLAVGDEDPATTRLMNRVGKDLQSTGMAKVARAVDRLPKVYYEAADLVGTIFQNPLLEARLARYPKFLTVAESPEFQAMSQDTGFSEMRLRRAPLKEIRENQNFQAVTTPVMLQTLWTLVTPDLNDLNAFLTNGISQKFDDKILGRWMFDPNAAMMSQRRARPNMPPAEMQRTRAWLREKFPKTSLIATPEGTVYLKNLPSLTNQLSADIQNIQGQWKPVGSQYSFTLGSIGERKGKIDGGRLFLEGDGMPLVFLPEN